MAVDEIAKIQIRRNTESLLPGAPLSVSPLVFSAALAVGELFFSTDTGRLFVGDNPSAGSINYDRNTLPYQNLEILTENSTDIIRTFVLSSYRDFGSEGYYSASLAPTTNGFQSVLIDTSSSTTAPYQFNGIKLHVKIEYFLFEQDGTPLIQGELRAATQYATDQAFVVNEIKLSSPVVDTLNNDDVVIFQFQKQSTNGVYSYAFQYTSEFAAPVKLLFRVTQPGNIFLPSIGFVTDTYIGNGPNVGGEIRYDGLSSLFAPVNSGSGGSGTGATGPTGPSGLAGAPGPVGPTGPQGFAGLNGALGATGPTGPTGLQGVTGPTGPTGQQGTIGAQGIPGTAGAVGIAGPQGAAGAVGPTGPQGLQGIAGAAGAIGTPGVRGATGPTGPLGLMGPTGPAGITGPVGPTGNQGTVGATGPTGMIGPTGVQGPLGVTGPTGPHARYTVVKQAYPASNADLLLCDTSGGIFTVSLPTSPSTGDSVAFRERGTCWNTNHMSIDPGSMPIAGTVAVLVCTGSTAPNFDLVYCGDSQGWSMVTY